MSGHHRAAALRVSRAALALLFLLAGLLYGIHHWRQQAIPLQPLLPTKFEHIDHGAIQCADCHHNWVDDTGSGTCYLCHKSSPEVNIEMEPMFHEFCWGCHIDKRRDQAEEEAGPVRECSLCHPVS